mgnify:CR=1 FL=1
MSDETPVAELGYEQARDELAVVVKLLEQGGIDLDESLNLWERGEALAALIPGSRFVPMPGLGHFPMSENYPVFGSYLKRALEIVKTKKKAIRVTPKNLDEYLGVPRFRYGQIEGEDQVGVVTGLAWTEVGGELLVGEDRVQAQLAALVDLGQLDLDLAVELVLEEVE